MGYLSLVLVYLACIAKDGIELEPVKLSFNCGRLTNGIDGDSGQISCQKSPYCYWNQTECVADPCLTAYNHVLNNIDDTCAGVKNDVTCLPIDLKLTIGSLQTADCSNETVNSGILCVQTPVPPSKKFDYCAYAFIRDQACPPSICEINTINAGCVQANASKCQLLGENDCKNVPKCFWNGSNKCIQDPCFGGSESKNCATWTGDPATVDTRTPLAAGDCIDFKPLKSQSTDIVNYCVYKNNNNPNICYFAPTGLNSSSLDDDGVTYPTYDFDPINPEKPTCSGTLPGCEGTGECYTTLNQRGALAGLYCTDGTHGAGSVLRIPSVLLFLVVCVLSMFIM